MSDTVACLLLLCNMLCLLLFNTDIDVTDPYWFCIFALVHEFHLVTPDAFATGTMRPRYMYSMNTTIIYISTCLVPFYSPAEEVEQFASS